MTEERYLTTKELAAYLAVSIPKARAVMRVIGMWLGNRYRVKKDRVDKWLAYSSESIRTEASTGTTTATSARRAAGPGTSRRGARVSALRRRKQTASNKSLRELAEELSREL